MSGIRLFGPIITPACTGVDGAGAATVTSSLQACGFVHSVYVQYTGDDPNTTDVTLTTQGTSPKPPATTVLSKADSATDGWYFPRNLEHLNTSGAALTTHDKIAVDDYLVVTVAQANTGDIITVWVYLTEA